MQKIIVTGAYGRLGTQIAQTISKKNLNQCLIGRNTLKLQELQQKLHSPLNSHLLTADLTCQHDLLGIIPKAHELMGGIDVLINNAALFGNTPFMNTEFSLIEDIINVNFKAILLLTQQATPYLQQSSNPKIINITSVVADNPEANLATYSASKAAINAFSKAFFAEMNQSAIQVCNLSLDQLQLTDKPSPKSIPIPDIIHTLNYLLEYPALHSFPTEITLRAKY